MQVKCLVLFTTQFKLSLILGKKITDFGNPGGEDEDDENIDETYGINVQFQESDEDEMDVEGKTIFSYLQISDKIPEILTDLELTPVLFTVSP